MAQNKKNRSVKKTLKKKSENKKLIRIVTLIIVTVFAAIYIFKPSGKYEPAGKREMNYHSPYQFTKNGELVFQSNKDEFITKIDIEIANTDSERALGLMFRDKMKENQGMLFIFDNEDYRSFWMKNTILPLDMIFVNADFKITNIRKHTKPYDLSQYTSTKPAKYVVEVNAGFTDKYNIKPGDKISFRIQ